MAETLDRLRSAVAEGLYDETGLLPAERDLSDQWSVSRTTVRRALSTLVSEGLLTQRHGVGTFVASARHGALHPTPPALPVEGFTGAMRRRGFEPTSRVLRQQVVQPDGEEAMMLACSPSEPILRLRRLRCIEDVPASLDITALPLRLRPDPLLHEGSLHAALMVAGTVPVRALQRIDVALATEQEASLLDLPPGSPVVRLRRTDYTADGACCLFTRATLRQGAHDLLMELHPPSGSASETHP